MAQQLLAYFSGDFTNRDAGDLRVLLEGLLAQGEWARGAPEFIDQLEEDSRTRPEDEPVRTVGVRLEVSEPGENPSTPVNDATRLVEALAGFSLKHGVEFEFQLDGTFVGEVRNGEADRLLRDGLLARW